MKNIFKKHQKLIFRSLGALLLVLGFVLQFWSIPKGTLSKAELAAANVARMEASVNGSSVQPQKAKPDASHVVEALKETQAKQRRYLTIVAMLFGVGFLGYSFIQKKE